MEQCKRIDWIDILRGIGIFFVVLGHILHNDLIVKWIFSFHLPIFFFISGFLYKKRDIKIDLVKRIKTILIPYYFFGILNLLYWILFERKYRYETQSVYDAFLGLITGNYQYLTFNIHLWFLPCFFSALLIYNILRRYFNCKIVFVISMLLYMICNYFNIPHMLYSIDKVGMYLIFVATGEICRNIFEDLSKLKLVYRCIIMCFCMGINILLMYTQNSIIGILEYLSAIAGIFVWAIFALSLGKNMFLEKIGQNTLVILCIHGPIYRVIVKITGMIIHLDDTFLRQNIMFSIVVSIMTLLVCTFIGICFNRYMPFILGKNSKK